MAVRIPTYGPISAPRGNFEAQSPNVPIGPGIFGVLGDAFGKAAQVVEQIDDRDGRAEAAKLATQAELDEAKLFDEQSAQAVANPAGFGGRYIEGVQQRNEQRLANASGSTRRYLAQMLPATTENYGKRAINFESDARRGKAATDLGTAYDNIGTSVATGNLSRDEAISRGNAILNDYVNSGLADPRVAEKLRGSITRDMTYYDYQARIRTDPAGVMRAIGVNPSPSTLVGNTKAEKIYNATAPEFGSFGAAGILGNLRAEQSEFDPTASHDGGTGVGIAGWRQDRRDALRAFAAERGTGETDFNTQVDFIKHELNTTFKDIGDRLKKATSAKEAAEIMMDYEKAAGWKQGDVSGMSQYDNRVAFAEDAYGAFGGDNAGIVPSPDMASLSPEDVPRLLGAAETELKAKRAENRALFDASIDNDVAVWSNGGEVTQPKTMTDFLAAYDPAEATVKYRAYEVTRVTGSAIAALKGKSNADIDAAVAQMKPTNPDDSQYSFKLEAYQTAQRAQAQIMQQRAADPAGYVQRNMDNVQQAWQDYASDASNLPQAMAVTQAAQRAIGIPPSQQQAVPASVRSAMIDGMTNSTPTQAWQQMRTWQNKLGDEEFGRLYETLSSGEGHLSRQYQMLAQIQDPTAAFAWVTALTAAKKEGTSVYETASKTIGVDAFKSLRDDINSDLQDYYNTLKEQGAADQINSQAEMALGIAVYSPNRNGTAEKELGTRAILDRYDIVSNSQVVARAPKGLGPRMDYMADIVRQRLEAGQLAQPQTFGPDDPYPKDALGADTQIMAQDAYWITNRTDTGWVLKSASGNIVRYKNEVPVEIRFVDLPLWEQSQMNEMRPGDIQRGVEQYVPAPTSPMLGEP